MIVQTCPTPFIYVLASALGVRHVRCYSLKNPIFGLGGCPDPT